MSYFFRDLVQTNENVEVKYNLNDNTKKTDAYVEDMTDDTLEEDNTKLEETTEKNDDNTNNTSSHTTSEETNDEMSETSDEDSDEDEIYDEYALGRFNSAKKLIIYTSLAYAGIAFACFYACLH